MVFAEIKPQIEQLPPAEMLKAMAFLKHLLRAGTEENRRDLSKRHADMEAGRKVGLEDAKQRLSSS